MRQSTVKRGYGARHKALREEWKRKIAQRNVTCARCGGLILPEMKWHLDHNESRDGYLGPSHERCNTSAGNRAMRRRQAPAQVRRQSQAW